MDAVSWINLAGFGAILGLGWRGYSKLDGKIDALGDKVSGLSERIAGIETKLSERIARIEGILSVSEHHEAKN